MHLNTISQAFEIQISQGIKNKISDPIGSASCSSFHCTTKHRPRLSLHLLLAVAIILEFLLFVIFNEEWKSIIPERNSSNDQETPRQESKIRRNNYSWAIHQFQEAGIPLNNSTSTLKQMQIPTNDDIEDLFSNDPLIFGEDEQCRDFLRRVPDPSKRWIGISGLFNSGTNLLFQLLDENKLMEAFEIALLFH